MRHAESIANTEGRYQGLTYDTVLSDLGVLQARALAERFQNQHLRRIISSPLKRTWQTAFQIAHAKLLTVERESQIVETNHGLWEGKLKEEIVRIWPALYRKWLRFPSNVKFPKGEHFLSTQKRVLNWWGKFIREIDNDTLVVMHDNILRIVIAYILNMKLNRIWKFHLQPTAVTHVELNHRTSKLIMLNDVSHMSDLQANLANHAL